MPVALARPFGPTLHSLASVLQAITPVLELVALPLPVPSSILVAPTLQPLAMPLPATAPAFHPIPVQLQPFAPVLEPPSLLAMATLGTRRPGGHVGIGALDGERVGRADLGRQRWPHERQRGGEGHRLESTEHAFLPAAMPRGSDGESGVIRTGG